MLLLILMRMMLYMLFLGRLLVPNLLLLSVLLVVMSLLLLLVMRFLFVVLIGLFVSGMVGGHGFGGLISLDEGLSGALVMDGADTFRVLRRAVVSLLELCQVHLACLNLLLVMLTILYLLLMVLVLNLLLTMLAFVLFVKSVSRHLLLSKQGLRMAVLFYFYLMRSTQKALRGCVASLERVASKGEWVSSSGVLGSMRTCSS
jgi:hypothetical protein